MALMIEAIGATSLLSVERAERVFLDKPQFLTAFNTLLNRLWRANQVERHLPSGSVWEEQVTQSDAIMHPFLAPEFELPYVLSSFLADQGFSWRSKIGLEGSAEDLPVPFIDWLPNFKFEILTEEYWQREIRAGRTTPYDPDFNKNVSASLVCDPKTGWSWGGLVLSPSPGSLKVGIAELLSSLSPFGIRVRCKPNFVSYHWPEGLGLDMIVAGEVLCGDKNNPHFFYTSEYHNPIYSSPRGDLTSESLDQLWPFLAPFARQRSENAGLLDQE